MLMSSIASEAEERHVLPDENSMTRVGVLQGRSLSYLLSSTSDESEGQTLNNFNDVQSHAVPQQTSSCQKLLQNPPNDNSLSESKWCVGKHSIKIVGDHYELVQMTKLVLDDYFCSNKFLQSEAYKRMTNQTSTHSTPTMAVGAMMPISQLKSSSPFADNSVGFNIENVSRISNLNESVTTVYPPMGNCATRSRRTHFTRKDLTDNDKRELCAIHEAIPCVHKYEKLPLPRKDSTPEDDMVSNAKDLCAVPIGNDLTRSRRSHFTRKDLEGEIIVSHNRVLYDIPEAVPVVHSTPEGDMIPDVKAPCAMHVVNGLTRSRRTHFTRKDLEGEMMTVDKNLSGLPIVYDCEQLMQHSESRLSLTLPKDWMKICEMWPSIVRK